MSDPRDELQAALGSAFTIERELGGGGMSRVFVASDASLGRKVVIKLLPPELGHGLSMERFKREIALAASLQHPHIVPLFSAGDVNGLPYFAMPFIEGETLRARLAKQGEMPIHEAVRVLREVASALDYAHEKGVVHRDIKPENVVLSRGSAMVLDFGVAKALSASGASAGNMTSIGVALGTPAYMSPEQATADPQMDHRADIYSFGVLAYELLTGQTPFAGRTPQGLLAAQVTEAPEDISRRRSTIPPALAALVMRCLEKRAADRPQSAAQVLVALDSLATPTAGLTPTSSAPMKRSRAMVVTAAISILVVALLAAWFGTRGTKGPLDVSHLVFAKPASDAGTAQIAQSLPDALGRAASQMSWLKVVDAPEESATSSSNVKSFAGRVGAGTVVTTAVTSVGDSTQLQFRVLDGSTGLLIRALDPVRVPRNADAASVVAAADGLLTTIGFVTDPELSATMLPLGKPPRYAAFREFELGMREFRDPNFAARLGGNERLKKVWPLDTTFFEARLWRAFFNEWFGLAARTSGSAEFIDSVAKAIPSKSASLSPFESALAEMVTTSAVETGDQALGALRRMLALGNLPWLENYVEVFLGDLNRPHEALGIIERRIKSLQPQDSASGLARRLPEASADIYHFIGDHKKELAAARKARSFSPNSLQDLRLELVALAALGDTAAVRKNLELVDVSAGEGRIFSFAGDVYLQVGQELTVHGFPEFGRATVRRGIAWLNAHKDDLNGTIRTIDIGLRRAIAYDAAGASDTALMILRSLVQTDTTDTRVRGFIGRILATKGDIAGAERELAWLASKPGAALQGAPTYERAAINARLGRDHWDTAVELLNEALKQGQGFGVRKRLHYFTDWGPLKDFPPFKQVVEPRG